MGCGQGLVYDASGLEVMRFMALGFGRGIGFALAADSLGREWLTARCYA